MSYRKGKKKPSLKSFFTNLGANMPWLEKLRLFTQNNWIKIKNTRNCCGHPGEPGC
jgi:hypothetical protein